MYDAIIIGSGIGGMTCGALLAKHGLNTLIVEQHSRPGGYVTSYKRQGFSFDVVHVIGGLRKDAPLERVFTYLGLDKKVTFTESRKNIQVCLSRHEPGLLDRHRQMGRGVGAQFSR